MSPQTPLCSHHSPLSQNACDRVAGQLEALILSDQRRTGDRLPAENELARQYGVSRTVIREAVRSLAAKGLLQVTQGSGTVVQGMTNEWHRGLSGPCWNKTHGGWILPRRLEVRRLLEVEIVGLELRGAQTRI